MESGRTIVGHCCLEQLGGCGSVEGEWCHGVADVGSEAAEVGCVGCSGLRCQGMELLLREIGEEVRRKPPHICEEQA